MLWLSVIPDHPAGRSSIARMEQTAVCWDAVCAMQARINEAPTEEKQFFSSKLGNLGIRKRRRMLESFHEEACLR